MPKPKWKVKLTVGFVPLPKEKEDAFWASMDYFASIIFREFLANPNGGNEQKENEMIMNKNAPTPLAENEGHTRKA